MSVDSVGQHGRPFPSTYKTTGRRSFDFDLFVCQSKLLLFSLLPQESPLFLANVATHRALTCGYGHMVPRSVPAGLETVLRRQKPCHDSSHQVSHGSRRIPTRGRQCTTIKQSDLGTDARVGWESSFSYLVTLT